MLKFSFPSSIIMVVASIYCIVIIYIPSVEEQNSKILPEPKRCVTTQVTCPDIHHDRLRVVFMKMVMALRTTMTKMMTSEGHLQEDDFRWSGTSPASPGTASAPGARAWSGASPRGRPAAARWQKDKITKYKQDKKTKLHYINKTKRQKRKL